MRIAYVISAFKCPRLLTRLVNRLHTPRSVFLIHVDKRTAKKQYREMVFNLDHLPNKHWGEEVISRRIEFWHFRFLEDWPLTFLHSFAHLPSNKKLDSRVKSA